MFAANPTSNTYPFQKMERKKLFLINKILVVLLYLQIKKKYSTPSIKKKYRYEIRAGEIFLDFTRFIENISNICISKYIYCKNIFSYLFDDTNYAPEILIFFYIYLIKVENN